MSRYLLSCLVVILAFSGGCRRAAEHPGMHVIRVWCHQGQEAENLAMRAIAAAFNDAHATDGLRVDLTFFPDFQYTEKLSIAAAAGDLPDAFDLDGPVVARLVSAQLLAPLERYFDADTLADFLPTIRAQGTVDGQIYALGAFDSAVVIYYDRELLAAAGVNAPEPTMGWTWDEFMAACEQLQVAGTPPIALHFDESADEWYTYAFSPVIWSAGGRLIAPNRAQVEGVLASATNVAALSRWQQLFSRGYAATDPVDPNPFARGAVAMDWSGHWMARGHLAAKGDRLGVMVLPRPGEEAVAPSGSWSWALSAQAEAPARAAQWLRWVTAVETGVVPIVRANGAVPGRHSAFRAFPEYQELPYSLFRHQLETIARARPRTPFYATLTQRFAAALRDIARGADVAPRLQAAEREIQAVIERRRRGTEDDS